MKVSLYSNVLQTTELPKLVDVTEILYDILGGKWKKPIEQLRESKDSNIKKTLPCVVFSGEMTTPVDKVTGGGKHYSSYRDDASLAIHSGMCVIDLDHITDIAKVRDTLCGIEEVYSVFTSPSGDGLKVIYRIPTDISKHRGYYKSILFDLESLGIEVDTTSINESRLCFVSYDPELYLNEYASMYMSYIEEAVEVKTKQTTVRAPITGKSKMTDYKKLEVSATMIDTCKDGYKHITLLKASYLMGGYIGAGLVREEDAVSMLRTRILNRDVDDPERAFKTIDEGIAKGKEKPLYEIEDIENDFETTLSRKEFNDENRGYSFLVNNDEEDDKLLKYLVDGEKQGFTTGSDALDTHFVFKENTFNIFLGHDNTGKSLLTWYLALCSASIHGWKWIIYSPENKVHRIKKQLIDFVLGKNSKTVDRYMLDKAKDFVNSHFFFIRKDREYNVFELLAFGEIMCKENKDIKGFLIDPYNSLGLDYREKGKGLSAYEYHLKAATHMRIFSEKNCAVFLNGHSVTGARRKMLDADGSLIRPQKDDMEQGSLWANRADDFIVIHRKVKSPTEWMQTEIHVDKVKDVETGGRVTFDEPVKYKLMYGTDFIDENGDSPLSDWRKSFFHGKQITMDLPRVDPQDAF